MAEGYDVQDLLLKLLGHPAVGWKLGVGSILQKRQSGIGRSIAGRIIGTHFYRTGETVRLPNDAPVTVEFEIAYVLGRDIIPSEPEFPAFEAVAEVRAAFEIVLSRFVDRRAVGWPSFAADNGAFHASILGGLLSEDQLGSLAGSLVVSWDGKAIARSLAGDDATDPVAALTDLIVIARERGMALPKGSIISTGTVSKPFNLTAASAEITARFEDGELGFKTLVNRATHQP